MNARGAASRATHAADGGVPLLSCAMAGEPTEHPPEDAPVREDAGAWKLFSGVVAFLSLALCVFVVILLRQNGALRRELGALQTQVASTAGIQAGERVQDLSLRDGTTLRLVNAERATLVLAASHSCGSCARTLPLWSAMASLLDASTINVVLLDIDAKEGSGAIVAPPPLKALGVLEGERTWLARLSVVPAAVLVGKDGVVARAWWGEATQETSARMLDEVRGETARLNAPTPK